jgi:hypothetical protein
MKAHAATARAAPLAAALAVTLAAGLWFAAPAQAADTTPPTVPQNLHSCGTFRGNDILCWDPSTDDSGTVDHYWIRVDGQQHARPRATTYRIDDLVQLDRTTPGPHTITVEAVDPSHNRSAPSSPLQIVVVTPDQGGS